MSSALGHVPRALAQTAPTGTAPDPRAKPEPPAAPNPEISDDARDLAAIVERRFGKHLKPEQLEAVTRELQRRLRLGKALREVQLANHDEPDFIFTA
jgi:hypothetical protein